MKIVHIFLVALLAVGLNAKSNPVNDKLKAMISDANKQIKSMNVKELKKLVDAEKDFILVDIREANEVAAGKIDFVDLKAMPAGELPWMIQAIKTDKKIVVYCKRGARGALATKLLKDLGYTNVYNLVGGITAWIEAGYPIETESGLFKAVK